MGENHQRLERNRETNNILDSKCLEGEGVDIEELGFVAFLLGHCRIPTKANFDCDLAAS